MRMQQQQVMQVQARQAGEAGGQETQRRSFICCIIHHPLFSSNPLFISLPPSSQDIVFNTTGREHSPQHSVRGISRDHDTQNAWHGGTERFLLRLYS